MKNEKFRIIIIDDNPEIHRDFIHILQISNQASNLSELERKLFDDNSQKTHEISLPEFEIETASQGEEGIIKIRKALNEGNPYTLAFVDIRMPPGIDGVETIKRIWAFDRDIQIVICTAYSDYSWEETIRELGTTDNLLILKKPFDVTTVRQFASALTQKWLVARNTRQHTSSLSDMVNEKTERLKNSSALLKATIESSLDGILVVDLKDKIVDYNKPFAQLFSLSESLQDKSYLDLQEQIISQIEHPEKYKKFITFQNESIEDSSIHVMRLKNDRIFECYSKPHRIDDKVLGRVWSFHEITEQIKLKEKLEYQATHDVLTNLPNRALLMDRMSLAISHAQRNNTRVAILFLDLDRFKCINDSLSHEVGDELLCALAKRLINMFRKEDTIARLGGDEFVMVFSLKSDEDFRAITAKAINAFEKPFQINHHCLKVTASIGISIYPEDGDTVNKLLRNADLAMYESKESGGNQAVYYTEELNKKNKQLFEVETELQRAIENNEFSLVYQPQFAIHSKEIISVEALLRWNHPEKGIIYPMDFLQVAENSGLIIPIGEWVIQECCRQLNIWKNKKIPIFKIAINIATKQLKQKDFADRIYQILKDNHIPTKCIEIEITENVIIDNSIQNCIFTLKEMGFTIILDDFGTGNASLSTLKKLKIDQLKIDQSFVKNIELSRGDEAIVEAIIAISHSMDFKVIAEGIEKESQIEFLKRKKCDLIQGFLWSKPIDAEQIELLFKKE